MQAAARSRHTGLVVSDLERSSWFYREIFGLETVCRERAEGEYIDTLTGIERARVEWIKLRTSDGYIIELLKYHAPALQASFQELSRANRPGCSHIALAVADVEGLYARLCDLGFHCKSAPLLSPDGRVKVMYAHDPDGIIIECVQELAET